ncbi:hypothetical protein CFN78_20195 [Amycolatopsis antarctica]|uniref:SH3 domain-containing protein n=1 Tax=Amycolatopsis antarctica TaxID=1854586 RepID=A0A263D011_9PSEU|nr:hypothetical protein CFN78_20195 [Amycolatopsis antarctica]
MGIGVATAATLLTMSAPAGAQTSDVQPADVHAADTLLYAGPNGASIRETASSKGKLVEHVSAGTGIRVQCRTTSSAGNYWYRIYSLPKNTYVYSGNMTSAPGIPSC